MILDTNFIVALRIDQNARALARKHETNGLPQRIPATTVSELYVAVGKGNMANENARKYEELIANLPAVPTSENIARRAGSIAGLHEASDSKPSIGLADATIAATALVCNEPVVTDDVDDFDSVDGVDIVTWN